MEADLRLINLDDFKVNNTNDIIIDFYPNRTFDGDIIVFLWKRECFGNIQYYKYFKECDEKNIRVTTLCVRNLFPIASQISHKCIMNTASIQKCIGSKITKHGLDRRRLWREYVDYGLLNISDPRKNICLYVYSTEIDAIIKFYENRPVYMDIKSYQLFNDIQNDLPENVIWIEVKRGYLNDIINEATNGHKNIYGVNKIPQLSLVEKHDLNDHFLSMQMLCSLKRSVKFIGVAGAGSLFLITPLLNAIFLADSNDNISPASLMYKTFFNEQMYGLRTLGGQYLSAHKSLNFGSSYLWDSFLSIINNEQEAKIPKLHVQNCSLPIPIHDFSRTMVGLGLFP